jgi:hypothetical protein
VAEETRALFGKDGTELHGGCQAGQKKPKRFGFLFDLDPSVLYRIAALPGDIVAALTPATLLTDPRTGRQTALREMSTRA